MGGSLVVDTLVDLPSTAAMLEAMGPVTSSRPITTTARRRASFVLKWWVISADVTPGASAVARIEAPKPCLANKSIAASRILT